MSRFLPLVCLSFAIAAVLDVVGSGAPLALRASGVPLSQLGWLQAIYLPTGLSFLFAPLVDRVRLLGRRQKTGWILVAMSCGDGFLALLALVRPAALGPFVLVSMAAGLAASVADLAGQALVVETFAADRRAWIVTARLVASSCGSAVGVLVIADVPGLTLSSAFVLVAAGSLILVSPMVSFPEKEVPVAIVSAAPIRCAWTAMGARAGVLGFYGVASIMLTTTPVLALVDLGVALPTAGFVGGPATTVSTTMTMIASTALLGSVPLRRQIAVLTVAVVASAALLVGALSWDATGLAVAASLLIVALDAGFNVPYVRLMYRWSDGDRVARDYALLSGFVFVISFPMRIAAPMLASLVGWRPFFVGGGLLYLAAGAILAAFSTQAAEPAR